jgi:colicin import membrane protein
MKTASAISTALHAAVLLWALVSFSGKTFEVTPAESLPVDLVTAEEFSKLAKGAKDAPKAEIPKPLVEKKDEPKPAETPTPKLTEKKEIQSAKAEPPPPPAEKSDAIAEKLKKQEDVKPEAKADAKPLPPRKPPREQPKFDPDKIATLLDKRDPQRHAATGEVPNQLPLLGASSGSAAQLSQSEIDALRARLNKLWNPPVGIKNPEDFVIRIRIRLGRDGRLAGPPIVLSSGSGQMFNSARDSAARAVLLGQPYDMLKPENYETWKEMEVTFDPRDMFRG